MTEVASLHVASHAELIFIIVISNQFKTGVKSTLTSQIKELGAIYTFGILKLNKFEPGLILVDKNDEKHLLA